MSNSTQVTRFKPSDTICSKVNVRPASKAKHIDELVSDIAHHGQLQPVIIRMEDGKPAVIAGQRRRKALIKLAQANDDVQLDAYVVDVDDMQAMAISLSENRNQLPMTMMDSYKAFSKLAKQGWDAESIGAVYSLKPKEVRQTLAIGELPASVMTAFEESDINDECIKLLAIAPKGRLNTWIKLYREGNAPTWGSRLRSFLANDKEVIKTDVALFDVSNAKLALIEDIFQDESFFADAEQFWELQLDEIDRIKTEYESKDWVVDIVENSYQNWAYTEVTKKKGGKVLVFISDNGRVEVVQGVLSNTDFRALERKQSGNTEHSDDKPKERPEVTRRMNEYCLGYLTQAAQSSVIEDYDLTQRVLLAMLLCADGRFSFQYSDTQARIVEDVTNGELAKTDKFKQAVKFTKAAYRKAGTKPDEVHRDFTKVFKKVMRMDIADAQVALSAVLASAITPNCDAVQSIHALVKPDMTQYWNAETSPSFVESVQGKPLLLTILENVANADVAELYEKSKVADIKAMIQEKAAERDAWIPAYFTGGCYGNGVGAPLA